METTLHQQLKSHYAGKEHACEQVWGTYRVDVVRGEELIEIQCSGLAALREKTRILAESYPIRIVKPIIRRTRVINKKWSQITSRRFAAEQGSWTDLFLELVHFVTIFPHKNLQLELLLIDIEEIRRPPKNRWRQAYRVEDRKLLEIHGRMQLRDAVDLWQLLPTDLPTVINTKNLAERAAVPRWMAQKIIYCLHKTGAVIEVAKQGRSRQYQIVRADVDQAALKRSSSAA